MEASLRRARRPDSLASAVAELLDEYQVPVPTHAVRTLLTAQGRAVTAEHLSRVAAYERADFARTGLPPRLCSVITPDAEAVSPRWWARGDWRLQRRILTEDARPLWLAMLAERWCFQLGSGEIPITEQTTTLALGTVARVLDKRYFDVPVSTAEWITLREQLVRSHPGSLHSVDSPTTAQHEAETRLLAAGTPAIDLYFGRKRAQ